MNIEDVTEEVLLPAVQKVIDDRGPDYVYETALGECHYGCASDERFIESDAVLGFDYEDASLEDAAPDRCLFGQALHEIGVEYDPEWDDGRTIAQVLLQSPISIAVKNRLIDIQQSQDGKVRYGDLPALPSVSGNGEVSA